MARVTYIADLSAPEHSERVACDAPGKRRGGRGGFVYSDERVCDLVRHGRRITTFVASSGQIKKISKGKGKLQITDRMIQRAR